MIGNMSQVLRRHLSHTPLWSLARGIVDPLRVSRWKLRGRPLPPPAGYKRDTLRQYARRYQLKTMVETGTFHGETGFAMKDIFARFVTIELSPDLHAAAVRRLSRFPNIECRLGDSSVVLPELLQTIEEPCLFWLDAHYSGFYTAKGELETPISAELGAVLRHKVRNHIVLIDDARCFDGTHDYPRLAELRESVLSLRPDMAFTVEHDIIRITPGN